MGKEKSKVGRPPPRDPLLVEMQSDAHVTDASQTRGRGAQRRARGQQEAADPDGDRDVFLPEDLSRRLLAQARDQQAEVAADGDGDGVHPVRGPLRKGLGPAVAEQRRAVRHGAGRGGRGHDDDDDEDDAGGSGRGARAATAVLRAPVPGLDDDEDLDEDPATEAMERGALEAAVTAITDDDERALALFMNPNPSAARRTLADVIADKIKEKEAEIASVASELSSRPIKDIDPKVIAVYTGVGKVLARYRSGALPKAFKIIPTLSNWEEILYLTDPDGWTPQAMFQATRIFASNLKEKMAQRFYNLVLLPRIREDFRETKQLNYHLYMALKKALYKPAAFFKGILLPLCEEGDCSLREAAIIGSIITKVSIPVLHSAAAMLKIAEMEYTGTNSLFLRILIDKKYALPFRVVDAVVNHFLRFQDDPRTLPVLWHQALLVFAQRYKEEMALEQKEALLDLLRHQRHYSITEEVRRELVHSKCRGDDELPLGEDALRERAARLAALAQDADAAEAMV